MEGYDVVTIEDEKVGKVVDTHGDNLIVEQGTIRKSKHALPRTFAEVDDGEQVVRMTVTKDIFCDSPKIDGEVDETAIALHYGLAEDSEAPATEGYDEIDARGAGARAGPRAVGRRDRSGRAGRVAGATRRPVRAHEGLVSWKGGSGHGVKTHAGHFRQQRLAVGLVVVPREDDFAHQVRVRELEAVVSSEGAREAADAALAADPAHLKRLGLRHSARA